MAKADEFRDQAAECLDRAKAVEQFDIKLELLGIAVAWLDLADCVEHAASQRDRNVPNRDRYTQLGH
jgi:hypothetical protein